jgi:hypothetical protein
MTGNIYLKSTHRISHKLRNSVCIITKLTSTGTQQTNIQNLTINQFCNMHATSSTTTNTTISIPTHSTIITVLFSAFLELKNGPWLFKTEIMPKTTYEVSCQSPQYFSGQILKYGFHPGIEWDVIYSWKFWSEKSFYTTLTRQSQPKTNISLIKQITYSYLSKNPGHLIWDVRRETPTILPFLLKLVCNNVTMVTISGSFTLLAEYLYG